MHMCMYSKYDADLHVRVHCFFLSFFVQKWRLDQNKLRKLTDASERMLNVKNKNHKIKIKDLKFFFRPSDTV